jgi:uncharacterized membrane protein
MRAPLLIAASALLAVGCEPVQEEGCVPLDTPIFHNVYELVLVQSCAVGGSCHAAEPGAGDLGLPHEGAAYENLVQGTRVVAGDAAGSMLMVRLDSDVNHSQHMPPGQVLGERERCMIAQWIDDGALP